MLSPEHYREVERSADFVELRKKFRNFAFPMTIAFLVWYFLYVLLSVYAVGWMSTRIAGNITTGLLISFLQFVTTFLITWLYIRHANHSLDPLSSKLKAEIEGVNDASA
ncbi:Uncharacterized membrane protein, DUF485 family [Raineyella antarctica]|uniref:Uncharacterized membrane protein, DUF485 family n=1 Tax=Raineyella antarctica TaxID=1577474 RepID=A0A1G6HRU1_9ACTN|nr:DUF485 domain-containing protein [Raineyella antarctica]SDB96950.1 Uncharacterized membrane protein, DUF485 family [Raineyella antarctica]